MTTSFLTDQTAEINDTVLHYTLQGEGVPLVLIHAGVADSRSWKVQLEAFAQYYQVLAYDLRGYGQSKMPANESYAHHEDLHAMLTHLNIESAFVVGMSMGGKTALNFILAYPDMVRGLVVIGSALEGYPLGGDYLKKMWTQAGEAFDNDNQTRAAEIEMEMWLVGEGRAVESVATDVRQLVTEMIQLSYVHETEAEDAEEIELIPPPVDRLSEIQAKTLVLIGEYDAPVMHDIATKIAVDIPNSQKIVLDKTAHLPNVERPGLLNLHILNFLRRV